ncbi:ATP-binding protein [Zavarzinella formosa]|uniref:ATP-binding protein n=1 Tax=Zavarzinella formosa TaxID=360055 RepID=UPI000378357A|nr:ATP-binding protein [Zavarzinella formosa]
MTVPKPIAETSTHADRVAGGEEPGSGEIVIGKVASPPHHESTSEEFSFWISPDTLVEKTLLVRTRSVIGGETVTFYGLVKEVYRQSRQCDLAEEHDRYDGDVTYDPPYESRGFNFAVTTILRSVPPYMCPPREASDVVLGGEEDAKMAYGGDEIEAEGTALAIGLVRNGGNRTAGRGVIDLNYLLGANGGHLNVNGVAGRGTKSSFLTHVINLLLREARRQAIERPGDNERLRVVPIILNVKNFDLFHLDRPSKRFDTARHSKDWADLGVPDPKPFVAPSYFAPQQRHGTIAVDTGRPTADVAPYSWSLKDVIERGLFSYLFADEDAQDANFGALLLALENNLTHETMTGVEARRNLRITAPQTFDNLLDDINTWANGGQPVVQGGNHHLGTIRKLHRRLFRMLSRGEGVLRRTDNDGKPLDVRTKDTRDPYVIDLSALAGVKELQRFVVAALFDQLVAERTGSKVQRGLVYLVMLDELNRFAPRGAKDPVTELIERVAAEMRSQGIILMGAQQQGSLVSTRVIENAGLRALGKSGSVELDHPTWKFLNESTRRKASNLQPDEKLLIQDSFREPMLVKVPMPPWALRGADAATLPVAPSGGGVPAFDDP